MTGNKQDGMHEEIKVRKWILMVFSAAVAFLVAAQLIPLKRTNPPVETDVSVPDDVNLILRRACYDCHSHETVWPWYSRVAPASWLVVSDVHRARNKLNFSKWDRLDGRHQIKMMKECWQKVSEKEMPPLIYLLAHPDARLTPADRELIHQWSLSEGL